jgi:hypothetical protein
MKLSTLLLPILLFVCSSHAQIKGGKTLEINKIIDLWHEAAAQANFDTYFNLMSEDAIFIGTDATENWTKKAFQTYAKPHFEKGKAWHFTSLKRNIYFSADKKTAWFDELLDTQMKICRGSGVLTKVKKEWKITHYVLSMSIPNALSDQIVKLKTASDDVLLEKLKK